MVGESRIYQEERVRQLERECQELMKQFCLPMTTWLSSLTSLKLHEFGLSLLFNSMDHWLFETFFADESVPLLGSFADIRRYTEEAAATIMQIHELELEAIGLGETLEADRLFKASQLLEQELRSQNPLVSYLFEFGFWSGIGKTILALGASFLMTTFVVFRFAQRFIVEPNLLLLFSHIYRRFLGVEEGGCLDISGMNRLTVIDLGRSINRLEKIKSQLETWCSAMRWCSRATLPLSIAMFGGALGDMPIFVTLAVAGTALRSIRNDVARWRNPYVAKQRYEKCKADLDNLIGGKLKYSCKLVPGDEEKTTLLVMNVQRSDGVARYRCVKELARVLLMQGVSVLNFDGEQIVMSLEVDIKTTPADRRDFLRHWEGLRKLNEAKGGIAPQLQRISDRFGLDGVWSFTPVRDENDCLCCGFQFIVAAAVSEKLREQFVTLLKTLYTDDQVAVEQAQSGEWMINLLRTVRLEEKVLSRALRTVKLNKHDSKKAHAGSVDSIMESISAPAADSGMVEQSDEDDPFANMDVRRMLRLRDRSADAAPAIAPASSKPMAEQEVVPITGLVPHNQRFFAHWDLPKEAFRTDQEYERFHQAFLEGRVGRQKGFNGIVRCQYGEDYRLFGSGESRRATWKIKFAQGSDGIGDVRVYASEERRGNEVHLRFNGVRYNVH